VARLRSGNDIVELALLKDAISRFGFGDNGVNLVMPYVPYARQDRICDAGESFSIVVFADLIRSMGFKSITIVDPHSAVTEAALRPTKVVTQFDAINKNDALLNRIGRCGYIIAPDAGAGKKLKPVVDLFDGSKPLVCAEKVRDMATGNILATVVPLEDFGGRDVIMIDDICDGGKTFIEIAKILKTKNVGKIILYVTHGLFSKGLEPLFQSGIDEIYTTDSIVPDGLTNPNLNIFKLTEVL
jgi:ribose-phosphate pyrophosphokinase